MHLSGNGTRHTESGRMPLSQSANGKSLLERRLETPTEIHDSVSFEQGINGNAACFPPGASIRFHNEVFRSTTGSGTWR
jgi:hypothetical protein